MKRPEGPRSELARYAFGWSEKKPGRVYWIVQAIVAISAIAAIFGLWGPRT